MVEKPISDEIPFDDLVQTYRVLVHSGAPIAQINAVRKHLSAVKGGRMARGGGAGASAFHTDLRRAGQRAGFAGQRTDHAGQPAPCETML